MGVVCVDGEGCDGGDGVLRAPGSDAIPCVYYVDRERLEGVTEEDNAPMAPLESRPALSCPAGRRKIRNQLIQAGQKKTRSFFKPKGGGDVNFSRAVRDQGQGQSTKTILAPSDHDRQAGISDATCQV